VNPLWTHRKTRLRVRLAATPKGEPVGLGVSFLLIAAGAILAWAVHAHVSGVDVHAVGWILLVVGLVALALSLIFWSSWFGPGYYGRRRAYRDYDAPPS
jgi:apolipoprotein N-acyltransferase